MDQQKTRWNSTLLAVMAFATAMIFAVTVPAMAQDTRQVSEPKIPPACIQLPAHLRAMGNKLRARDESKLDTLRIQKAIDACGPGKSVELRLSGDNDALLTGPLEMRSGVTLLVDKGVTLFGSRNPADYEYPSSKPGPGLCGTILPARPQGNSPRREGVGQPSGYRTASGTRPGAGRILGCRPLISIIDAKNVGIMGDGVIDGRGYATILGKDYSWWQLARRAEPGNQRYLNPRMIVARNADGLVLYRITLHNSTNYHVSVSGTNGFTAWGVHILTPTTRGMDARNTDGIDPGSSTNITVAQSWIDNGDDNIAIKTGVSHMSVIDNHFYDGHGMSIGSETFTGDSDLLVDGLSEDHTTSGIRIKSNVTRGGLVHDLVYRNICMREVANPIAISPYYNNQTVEGFVDPGLKGNRIPDYKGITIENVTDTTAGNVLLAGYDDAHRTEVKLNGVYIRGITPAQVHGEFATATVGPLGTNLNFDQTQIKVVPAAAKALTGPAYTCTGKFPPMQ
ncbi:MAG: glycoside hydrolase family 28 protein [Acidobacteriota bacterium]